VDVILVMESLGSSVLLASQELLKRRELCDREATALNALVQALPPF
jgi:hypothetical protein